MFDVDFSELAVVGLVALLVVGPKDLPKLMRTVGHWMGRARGMARHLRTGFDTMVRESEIDELNKRWEQQNQEIMAATRVDSWADNHAPAADQPVMLPLAPASAEPAATPPSPTPPPPAGQLA